jgi:hypothetical protein
LDILATKYGTATHSNIMAAKESFAKPFDPATGTFPAFVNDKKPDRDYLIKNGNDMSRADLYTTAKLWVVNEPLLLPAIANFEMNNHTAATQTYEALIEALVQFAETNANALTAHQIINEAVQISNGEAKTTSSPDIADAVANEVRRQIGAAGARPDTSRAIINAVKEALKAEAGAIIDDTTTKRIMTKVYASRGESRELKKCTHHPASTNHNTEDCSITTGIVRKPYQKRN